MQDLELEATMERRLHELEERRKDFDQAIAYIELYLECSTEGPPPLLRCEARKATRCRHGLTRRRNGWRTFLGHVLVLLSGCEALWLLGA